jgi:hypothetical protein
MLTVSTVAAALLAAPACHRGDADDTTTPDVQPDAGMGSATPDAPEPAAVFHLTVQGGSGGGDFHAGDTVHVWADLDPSTQVLAGWGGDSSLLARPLEWHTTFVMPARDVSLTATARTVTGELAHTTFTGPTGLKRNVYSRIPSGAKGLLLILHGTGGSARMVLNPEPSAVARVALDHGYGVLATEAAEVIAGDLDNNGKIRWSTAGAATNKDFIDLDALFASLVSAGSISATTPIYALGMSNGGAMSITLGAVSASPLASTFPHLRFAAVVSHCADGIAQAVSITTTPTAWRMCANDDNTEVSNTEAQANHATLVTRGIDTDYLENPPSPLYDARFVRIGLDLATSTAIAGELRAYTDPVTGLFTSGSATILADQTASPTAFPTISAQSGTVRGNIKDQLRVMEAEHEMFSDLAAADLAWLDAH